MLQQLTIEELLAIIEGFRLECEKWKLEREELKSVIAQQALKIASLESELAKQNTPKNSGNSHLPPSSDFAPPKRNQSLREKSNKEPGGQFGHTGHTLKMKENPDKKVPHDAPCTCGKCGKDISEIQQEFVGKRQVVDIPPVAAVYTEHSIYSRTCDCGHSTESSYPPGVNSLIQYSADVEAMVAYEYARQYVPFERMSEYFHDVFGIPICAGTIVNMINRFAAKAKTAYEAIKRGIEQSAYVGSDETGGKENGKKIWFWTWQNDRLTYIVYSKSRGYDTVETVFPEGLPNTIIGHDRWAAQLKCIARLHQICMAHLLRDLNFIEQLYKDSHWATDFKTLIKDALSLKKELEDHEFALANTQRDTLENKLKKLLGQVLPANDERAISIQNSLRKIEDCILVFLHHSFVPPDNNGSEQAIRNVKVKQKISGQFRSEEGAKSFAVIRSVIDTTIKTGKEVFNELCLIANLVPAPAG